MDTIENSAWRIRLWDDGRTPQASGNLADAWVQVSHCEARGQHWQLWWSAGILAPNAGAQCSLPEGYAIDIMLCNTHCLVQHLMDVDMPLRGKVNHGEYILWNSVDWHGWPCLASLTEVAFIPQSRKSLKWQKNIYRKPILFFSH